MIGIRTGKLMASHKELSLTTVTDVQRRENRAHRGIDASHTSLDLVLEPVVVELVDHVIGVVEQLLEAA